MVRDEKAELLATVNSLRGCSRSQLRDIARLSDLLSAPAGRVLVTEGAAAREVFLIVRGEAEVSRGGRPVAVLRPSDYFGEVGVLASQCRDAQVAARTDLEVLVIGAREFLGLLAAVPALNRTILGGMASRLHNGDVATAAS